MAGRLIANLIVVGSGVLVRAVAQAYRQALQNASKNGVAQEAMQNVKRVSKMMSETEARQILGVSENASWEEILKSKVFRAKECLESAAKKDGDVE
ncbi:Mitochondrial import inner membrane translocase subunit PAM16 like 2 [Linum perenne]